MMPRITFHPIDETTFVIPPKPAIHDLPDWYRKASPYIGSDTAYRMTDNGNPNFTFKKCVPFLDAMTAGYFLYLNGDLNIDPAHSEYTIQWRASTDLVGVHSDEQINAIPFDRAYFHHTGFKFDNQYVITTPRGYSCLFVHPMNRTELPFMTVAGIVDTDKYNLPINFPFFLKNDFQGIIPAGTPIVQVIPFRRESWNKNIASVYQAFQRNHNAWRAISKNYYRRLMWSRKHYR